MIEDAYNIDVAIVLYCSIDISYSLKAKNRSKINKTLVKKQKQKITHQPNPTTFHFKPPDATLYPINVCRLPESHIPKKKKHK